MSVYFCVECEVEGADEHGRCLSCGADCGLWELKPGSLDARLRTFVLEVIREGREGDVDGGWLQDRATELGILVEVEVSEPCDPEGCVCAEVGDFPLTCYRIAPELLP